VWRGTHERGDKCIEIFVENIEGKIPLGRTKHREEDNIKMAFIEMEWKAVDWIHGTHDMDQWRALVNMMTNLLCSVK
jgi:hypothetical protein